MEQMNGKVQSLMKNKFMLWIMGAVGVVLLFNPFDWFRGGEQTAVPSAPQSVSVNTESTTMSQYEQAYEKRLTEILDTVRGVNDVQVMVNIDSTEEIQYAIDSTSNKQTTSENAKDGGTRTLTQFDESGKLVMLKKNGTDQPVVVKTIKPRVRGVVVVAKGAEDVKIQALITDAVQRALEVPPHKISILPKKTS